jgi:hypothetical protein
MRRGTCGARITLSGPLDRITIASFLLLALAAPAFGASPIFVRTDGDDTICSGEVDAPVGALTGAGQPCAALTINQGVALVDVGGTVNVAAGTYAEEVVLDKKLTLAGAGSGPAGTVIDSPSTAQVWSNASIEFQAGGDSALDRLVVRDVRTIGAYHGLMSASTVSFITIQDVVSTANERQGLEIHNPAVVTDLQLIRVDLINNGAIGFKVPGVLDGLDVIDGHIDGNLFGVYFNTPVPIDNVSFAGTTFNNNTDRGMYILNLSNAIFRDITVDGNGDYGIDLNSRSAANSNVQILDSTISNNGFDNLTEGAGLMLTARLSGGGSLDDVLLDGVTITGNQFGLLIGERSSTDPSPTNVVVQNSEITGNLDLEISNTTVTPIDATLTWWGTQDPIAIAAIVGPGVTFIEFLCEPPATAYMSVGGVCPPPPIPGPDPVPVCETLPIAGCRQVTRARASRLMISRGSSATRNRVRWSWRRGAETLSSDFGDPTDTTSYALCIYDETGGSPNLLLPTEASARSTCGAHPCWSTRLRGVRYFDGTDGAEGLRMVRLRPGAEGRARIDYLFRGANLSLPTMPLDQDTTVTVQAVNSIGECWSAQYSAPARTNTANRFVDRSD